MILHLGVLEIPYNEPPAKGKRKKVEAGTQTTGDVAEWLENKYKIMATFYERNQEEIAQLIIDGLAGTIESLSMGAPPTIDPFGEATSAIKDKFSRFLESKAMDGLEGIPTLASIEGVSHRFKNRRGTPYRPSFIDTGNYENAFQAWID